MARWWDACQARRGITPAFAAAQSDATRGEADVFQRRDVSDLPRDKYWDRRAWTAVRSAGTVFYLRCVDALRATLHGQDPAVKSGAGSARVVTTAASEDKRTHPSPKRHRT